MWKNNKNLINLKGTFLSWKQNLQTCSFDGISFSNTDIFWNCLSICTSRLVSGSQDQSYLHPTSGEPIYLSSFLFLSSSLLYLFLLYLFRCLFLSFSFFLLLDLDWRINFFIVKQAYINKYLFYCRSWVINSHLLVGIIWKVLPIIDYYIINYT